MKACLLFLLGLFSLMACGESECAQLPPSFELLLEVEVEAEEAHTLSVTIETPDGRFSRDYEVNETLLEDGLTSLAVQIDPPPTTPTRLTIIVALLGGSDGQNVVLSRETGRFTLQPNGCNLFNMELEEQPDL